MKVTQTLITITERIKIFWVDYINIWTKEKYHRGVMEIRNYKQMNLQFEEVFIISKKA